MPIFSIKSLSFCEKTAVGKDFINLFLQEGHDKEKSLFLVSIDFFSFKYDKNSPKDEKTKSASFFVLSLSSKSTIKTAFAPLFFAALIPERESSKI